MHIYALGILEKEFDILLLLGKNAQFFNDYYGLVGGKIEAHESIAQGLIHEVREEIGIVITQENMRFAHCLSGINENNKDILIIVFSILDWQGTLVNQEPDRCSTLGWFKPNALPENIIPRHAHILRMVKMAILYSEINLEKTL